MRAGILAIGSELLGTRRLDTNSLRITELLREFGVELVRKGVVGDLAREIAALLEGWLSELDLVICTGGLGPTADDRTRQGVAEALGRQIRVDEEIAEKIQEQFAALGRKMPEVNRRQAQVIEGATLLENSRGTAPGQRLENDGKTLFLLPGVPAELDAMLEEYLRPWLRQRAGDERVHEHRVYVTCMPESEIEDRLGPVYRSYGEDALSVLASPGLAELVFTAWGEEGSLEERLEEMVAMAAEALGAALVDSSGGQLEEEVGRLLAERGETVACAESCTGGLVGERLTRVPGASAWFRGGVVAYANDLKSELLDVRADLLERCGAVSEEVAVAMAVGACRRLGSDWGVGVTGIAGPGGGTREKPRGLVYLAVARLSQEGVTPRQEDTAQEDCVVRGARFSGDRARVRELASQWALDLLRRRLAGLPLSESLASSPEYSG